MDPDMVRQQEEAEREALALRQKLPLNAMTNALVQSGRLRRWALPQR